MSATPHKVFTISSSDGSASAAFAPTYGARGISLNMNVNGSSRELIYTRPDFWTTTRDAGGLPFLFPVCGRHILNGHMFKYEWNGRVYDMPMHGFSLKKPWIVSEHSSDRLVMELVDDDDTRRCYPFSFRVVLDYRITDTRLICRHTYENRGENPLPFYSGFHPYFAIDTLDSESWWIEGAFHRAGTYDETYTSIKEWRESGTSINPVEAARCQSVFSMNPHMPVRISNRSGLFLEIIPNQVGDSALHSYMQTYRSNQDPFICLEPWMTTPNGLNEPHRITLLPPGESRLGTFTILR